jgi:hypothetical protein
MRPGSIPVLSLFLFGFASLCIAAEDKKDNRIDALTSMELGNYSLKFEGEAPKTTIAPGDPAGLMPLKKESLGPFLGLRLSTPLRDDFFKPSR